MDPVTGGWRKLHNEVLHNRYSSAYLLELKRVRCPDLVACIDEDKAEYTFWVGMLEGKKPL
jgi:hypothetical protein